MGGNGESKLAEAGGGEAGCDERRELIKIRLTCPLCKEPYKEATTITECIHTFCRACLDSKLQIGKDNECPTCRTPLGADPYQKNQIRFDAVLNDIVTKLFPREGDSERDKQREVRSLKERALLAELAKPKKRKYNRRPKVEPPPPPPAVQTKPALPTVQRQPQVDVGLRPALVAPAGLNALSHASPSEPATEASEPKGGSKADEEVIKIIMVRHKDSKYPQLSKSVFKVYGNVTVRTLLKHLSKRILKTVASLPDVPQGGDFSSDAFELRLTQDAEKAIPKGATVKEVDDQVKALNLPVDVDTAACKFTLVYKERVPRRSTSKSESKSVN
ncbi:RING-type domain-containing protein [Chloropicon primus]|uniref:RING-type domain-containing protein n=1 Tax=Chloropicon primus TaxID=1764295 RepID=A0A5B8MBP2_9CHLO|nr:hypothetical protein A3770_01p03050 [Chloropicon primus]UPQ97004.1 RING-type domain-containing protein [Chloropicon primus]|eukprot:QDZ17787.1 hypothetical protein A3770_01p03050 [Chloropicon primus]